MFDDSPRTASLGHHRPLFLLGRAGLSCSVGSGARDHQTPTAWYTSPKRLKGYPEPVRGSRSAPGVCEAELIDWQRLAPPTAVTVSVLTPTRESLARSSGLPSHDERWGNETR